MPVSLEETMAQLESLGNEKVRAMNKKHGAVDNQFGIRMGDIRKVAAKIKTNHPLALELWQTENLEARLVATLVMEPRKLSPEQLEHMVQSVGCTQLADWFNSYVVKSHPNKESLRSLWMDSPDPWVARSGWSLTWERITKNPEGLDLTAILDRIESELATTSTQAQWTMNFCLAGIGIHFPEHRERAISLGERLGIYRDFPVSKGCTSPFAPIWIKEMVSRQG